MPPRAITIAIVAMGGEGGGVLADWIVDLAEHSGYYAQTTSVPGVAQRTGSTMYYVELFPEDAIRVAGKEPVLALMPVPGELDIVVASELMEAGRAVQRGLVTPDRTTLIASTHRVYSMTEKTAMGDGRVDSQKLLDACAAAAKTFVSRDFAEIVEQTGSVISAALFGALAAAGALPFTRQQFEDAIRRSGVGVERSLAAFASGAGPYLALPMLSPEGPAATSTFPPIAERIRRNFPPASHAILQAAVQRLVDYQDYRYASEYLNRLTEFRDGDPVLLRETARYLALWMSYEDAIRVADLKTRRARFERVHRETRVSPAQVLKIHEFLHPRVAEIADILPAAIGSWLMHTGWAKRAINRLTGHGIVVETTSVFGYFQLYGLAGMRRWRRSSLRFEREHRKMADWLATVRELALEDCALAREVAECPRLIKGYGDTHVRGSMNYDAIMKVLPKLRRVAALGRACPATTDVPPVREFPADSGPACPPTADVSSARAFPADPGRACPATTDAPPPREFPADFGPACPPTADVSSARAFPADPCPPCPASTDALPVVAGHARPLASEARPTTSAAERFKRLRELALSDETGERLAAALKEFE